MNLIEVGYKLAEKPKHIARLLALKNVSVVNIQLKTGETIPEHDSKREVIIVVRRGAVVFDVEGVEALSGKIICYICALQKCIVCVQLKIQI